MSHCVLFDIQDALGAVDRDTETEKERRRNSVKYVDASRQGIVRVPVSVLAVTALQALYLEGNRLTTLPDEFFEQLPFLEWLDLRNNLLISLPSSIGQHQNLKNLLLGDNRLRALPQSLGLVRTLTGLNVAGNPLEFPPQQVINQGTKIVLAYLRNRDGEEKSQQRKPAEAINSSVYTPPPTDVNLGSEHAQEVSALAKHSRTLVSLYQRQPSYDVMGKKLKDFKYGNVHHAELNGFKRHPTLNADRSDAGTSLRTTDSQNFTSQNRRKASIMLSSFQNACNLSPPNSVTYLQPSKSHAVLKHKSFVERTKNNLDKLREIGVKKARSDARNKMASKSLPSVQSIAIDIQAKTERGRDKQEELLQKQAAIWRINAEKEIARRKKKLSDLADIDKSLMISREMSLATHNTCNNENQKSGPQDSSLHPERMRKVGARLGDAEYRLREHALKMRYRKMCKPPPGTLSASPPASHEPPTIAELTGRGSDCKFTTFTGETVFPTKMQSTTVLPFYFGKRYHL